MKTNALSLLALTGALFLMAACASEETNNNQEQAQKPDTKGLTAFTVDGGATRTTAEYDGSGLNFYWTEGDRLWVNNGTLIQDNSNNISAMLTPNPTTPTGVKRAATARFYFAGTYTAHSYPVRYTGKGSTVGNKVTIKAQQSQALPNDAAHISTDGDCGTGTAISSGGGYNFTLDHKASYLTLLPYSTINFATTVKLTQVKITADEALSGQFNFDDSGIDLGSRPAPTPANRSITLKLAGGGTNGFTLPVAATPNTNAAVVVLPPGTYNNVAIEYTLYDQFTTRTTTIKKEYTTLAFTPGKNKKVSTNLQMMERIFPLTTEDGKGWYGARTNACLWYMIKGDPRLDMTTLCAYKRSATSQANIYIGGVWLKKAANIPGFSSWYAPDGKNYNGGLHGPIYGVFYPVSTGKPANTDDYFFLPSIINNGAWGNGLLRYWIDDDINYSWGLVFAVDPTPSPQVCIGAASHVTYLPCLIPQ